MLRNQTHSSLLGWVTLMGIGLVASLPTTASAQTTYYTGTASTGAWNTSRWSTSSSGPFNASYVANGPVSFTSGSYSFAGMGASTNVGNVTVLSNVNVAFPTIGSTYATNGTVQTVDVAAGGVYDLAAQTISTAAGTGFLKTGTGAFALGGAAYTGGFTLNAGTVILRGVNAMGGGGALALNGGAVAGSATRNLTDKYAGGITIGGNVQFGEFSTNVALANDTANLTFSNAMSLGAANRTLMLGNKGNVTFGGVIANTSGGITFAAAPGAEASVSGAGRFDITGTSNTFTGDLSFTGAEVRVANNGSLGNAANNIVINGGRFGIVSGTSFTIPSSRSITVGDAAGTSISTAGSGTLTYDGVIANISGTTGSWVKQGGGTLSLGGSSTYTGATTISNGTIQLTAGNNRLPVTTVLSLGQATSANVGTFNLGGVDQTVAGLASIVGTNASAAVTNLVTTSSGISTLTLNVASGTYSYGDGTAANSGGITGSVGIVKQGAGTQILGGSSSYTRPTTLSAGTLRGGHNFAFGSGTLALNGGTLTSGTDGVARSFANSVAIGGDIQFGDAAATGGLTLSGPVDLGSGARSLTVAQSTTLSGLVSNGGLIKAGAALLLLTGTNTYAAGTSITAGTLKAGNSNSFGSGSVTLSAGATLDLNSLTFTNSITNNGGTLANAGSFSGTSSVSGTADYGGAGGGTVVVDAGGVANFNGSINSLTISAGGQANLNDGSSLIQATLTNDGLLVANRSSDTTFSTAIGGSGAFEKLGSGILTVTGNSTYSGATTVSAGRLKVNGSLGSGGLSVAASAWLMGTGTVNGPVTVSGTFSPGSSPGVITLGSLVLTSTSTTIIEVLGATRGTSYDGIDIATASGLTYGGLLSFEFGGSALADGTYDIFNFAGTSSGSFTSLDSTGFYAGTWTNNSNGSFTLVKEAQTLTFSQSTGDIIVVPEPATLALAAAGAAALACALRRRR